MFLSLFSYLAGFFNQVLAGFFGLTPRVLALISDKNHVASVGVGGFLTFLKSLFNMEFEPEIIETISEMLGARINSKNVKEEKDDEEEETTSKAKTAQTKFLIRPGREQDVITDSS